MLPHVHCPVLRQCQHDDPFETLRRRDTLDMRIALLTGTVGIGKSTTGYAAAERAASQGHSAAFLDVDELSRLWPARAGDPFNTDLILRNLASLVGNYADAGAELLVLAWVVQNTDDLLRLEDAVGASVVAFRLSAATTTVEARLRQRHQGTEFDGLAWHLDRAPELVAIQDRGLRLPIVDAAGSISETADTTPCTSHLSVQIRSPHRPCGAANL